MFKYNIFSNISKRLLSTNIKDCQNTFNVNNPNIKNRIVVFSYQHIPRPNIYIFNNIDDYFRYFKMPNIIHFQDRINNMCFDTEKSLYFCGCENKYNNKCDCEILPKPHRMIATFIRDDRQIKIYFRFIECQKVKSIISQTYIETLTNEDAENDILKEIHKS